MKKPFYLLFIGLLLTFAQSNLMANNIQVSNVALTNQNTTDDYTMVRFDLTWGNSWRTSSAPNNWDAAWVFVKYRVSGGDWQHARLNNTGHSLGTGTASTIDAGLRTPGSAFDATTNPAVGVFIYRSANGTGTFSIAGAQLRWNYGANGVADNADVDVKVFAIEMVYVPQGNFYVGTGANPAEASSFTQANKTSGATVPFQITSTPPTIQGNNAGSSASNLGARGQIDLTGTNTALLAAGFPTGFAAFYSMKYEISQQQYVDFLNTLTQTQANARMVTITAARYAIAGTTVGSYATTNPYVACNWLSWMDGAAYSDWAGLRPMTELEFEKASRGTITPVANEYAWGTMSVKSDGTYTLNNQGAANEGIATGYSLSEGNANYAFSRPDASADQGPMRVGVFATGSSTRVQSGASYYGIMELSGNLWERPVTVGNTEGRLFTGVHGDGVVSSNGHANEAAWPGLNSNEVTGADGSGFRGGYWNVAPSFVRVSDRFLASVTDFDRSSFNGFRAVRVVP